MVVWGIRIDVRSPLVLQNMFFKYPFKIFLAALRTQNLPKNYSLKIYFRSCAILLNYSLKKVWRPGVLQKIVFKIQVMKPCGPLKNCIIKIHIWSPWSLKYYPLKICVWRPEVLQKIFVKFPSSWQSFKNTHLVFWGLSIYFFMNPSIRNILWRTTYRDMWFSKNIFKNSP